MNCVELTGILIERKVLRFTPAAVPVTECVIGHQSEQVEAGNPRRVECEIQAIALGETARWLQAATPGIKVHLTGFLAAKSQHSKQLRLHVTMIEFVEGNQNG
ncbi:MAG: primosomal replication protein N [Propionivibrio sp.]|uniref:primosomal replication protein N n=1 Tax=Propionivibrio sp. TaxID=2212460 RepID=UPI001A52F95B|nr:primosomal replication protein N [Propionivibrio sp.]MBL8415901.1 primosomal replication protein N [Propionivibrio sp.]